MTFSPALGLGFFSIISVTGIDPLSIMLNTTDLLVTQRVVSKTGPANRLGIVSFNPVTVGSSPTDMYISATTFGPPGFYTFTSAPANPAYQIGTAPPPVGTVSKSWGAIKQLYR